MLGDSGLLLDHGASLLARTVGDSGLTPLMCAVVDASNAASNANRFPGHVVKPVEVVDLLLRKAAEIDLTQEMLTGRKPCFHMRQLVLTANDFKGRSVLHLACLDAHADSTVAMPIVDKLITALRNARAESAIAAVDYENRTPLHCVLMNKAVDTSSAESEGVSTQARILSSKVLGRLLDENVNAANAFDINKWGVFHYLAAFPNAMTNRVNHQECAELIYGKIGANQAQSALHALCLGNGMLPVSSTPLHVAVRCGNVCMVEFLREKKVNVAQPDGNNQAAVELIDLLEPRKQGPMRAAFL